MTEPLKVITDAVVLVFAPESEGGHQRALFINSVYEDRELGRAVEGIIVDSADKSEIGRFAYPAVSQITAVLGGAMVVVNNPRLIQ